jgi:site-specific DNA recombinase
LHLNQQQATRNNQHPERALLRGGIARCGYCGYALYPNSRQSPYGVLRTVYMCSHRHRTHPDCQAHSIAAHLLDNAVWAKVSTVLKNRSLIEQEIEHMRATEAPGTDVLASIDKIIADLSAQIARKRRLFELTDDEKTQNELADEINQLAALRRGYESERVNAELHYADWQQQRDGLQQALDWCERLGEHVDTFSYEQRRTTLLALKVAVQLWRADHKPRARLTIRLPLSDIITLELETLELSTLAYCAEDGSSSSYHVSSLFQ